MAARPCRAAAGLGASSTRVRDGYRATERAKGGKGQARRENGGRHYRAETSAVTSGRRRRSELSGLGPGKGKMTAPGVLFSRPSHAPVSLVLWRWTTRATAGQGRQWRGSVESKAGGVERRGSAVVL
uniref:Uncharacterized protein n=1 Tax=Oryza sativa subsp. japonica TaxID=39947 RepID=Q6ZAG9_ORYSJ|nr:hypothetical protein [Oryza sativa Japonica Group]